MTQADRHWTLGAKLALIGLPFMATGLLLAALTLWVSWQLGGGAAAVNEAGRMRMQVYRMAWAEGSGARSLPPQRVAEFERSLGVLRRGDPERPLATPWDDAVRARFAGVELGWDHFQSVWRAGPATDAAVLDAASAGLVGRIDALVAAIESHLSRWTSLLHLLQLAMMALALLVGVVLVVTGYRFVLEPVAALKQAFERIRQGDFGARVERSSSDEFGTLADGFNDMTGRLQQLYHQLESRVADKTAELTLRRERLQALYEISTLVSRAGSLHELAQGFTRRVRAAVHADAAALRWSEEGHQHFMMLASEGLPASMVEDEHCIRRGDCHCGVAADQAGTRVIPIQAGASPGALHCERAGWATVVSVPIRFKDRLMGEVDLFFHAQVDLSQADRSLLEALSAHLASGLENLRLQALEKEAAIAQERGFLARELHDSIAQSLAFLKIQVQLMHDAMVAGERGRMAEVLAEIELGVRESHGDVRELLMHFRTRTNAEDIEPALHTTLRKFEHQTGIPSQLTMHGQGLPLAPDLQIQALHIVQEALSNVRKHARAGAVRLDVWRQPVWRFEVSDDGVGFDRGGHGRRETHLGLRIMAERAERMGARVALHSAPGAGTRVVLTMPGVAAVAAVVAPATAAAAAEARA